MAEWPVLLPDHHPGFIDWPRSKPTKHALIANGILSHIKRAAP